MASETQGKIMSDYTDIDLAQLTHEEKDYYKTHASVTTFGKIDGGESTVNSNYNVKLSEISKNALPPIAAGDTGKVLTVGDSDAIVWDEVPSSQPNYGEGLEYDSNTNTLKFSYLGSGGLTYEHGPDETRGMKVKAGKGIKVDNAGVSIDTDTAEDGQVLSYDDTTNKVKWVNAGGGGGGGGNPYTKVSVTPGERYKNGKTSDYDWELYDQDVSITNNTYAVVSSPIGYTYTSGFPDAKGIDVFKIKLPANTDFPMAVVEFTVYQDDNYNYGAVNDVEVYVGNTKLTRLYSHPFRKDTLVGRTLYSNKGQEHITDGGQNYWKIDEIQSSNTLFSKTTFVADADNIPIVQINIFGNCYTVSANVPGDAPAAS